MLRFKLMRRPVNVRRVIVPICAACIGTIFSMSLVETGRAQQVQWSNKKAQPRIQSLSVPIRFKKYHIGDAGIRIYPSGKVTVQLDPIVKALKPGIKPKHFLYLSSVPAGDSGYTSLQALRKAGFKFRFDQGEVSLFVDLTVDQLKTRDLALVHRRKSIDSQNVAHASTFSASFNMFFGLDYVSQTLNGDTGLYNPRLDLEGAVNIHGFVIEGEATVEAGDGAFGSSEGGFKRRGTRIVKDFVSRSLRVTAGDVSPLFTSFQSGRDLLGVSIEHNISKLNPGRDIRATSRRSFRIERDSDVQIFVNGRLDRTRRLQAGDYKLTDLPGTAGANNIELVIRDDVGHKQVLKFTTFLDGKLLSPDYSEWAVSAGTVALTDDGEPDYTANPVLSGYYRRGITEFLTGEAHLQGDETAVMGGGGLLWGSTYGLINTEAAMSFAQGGGFGYALRVDYAVSKNLINSGPDAHRSLNLSAEYRSAEFSAVGEDSLDDETQLILSLGYSQKLFYDINASVSANFTAEEDGSAYGANLNLTKRLTEYLDGGLSFGYKYDDNPIQGGEKDQFSAEIRLSYSLDETSGISAFHDVFEGTSGVAYHRNDGQGVGAWGININAEHDIDKATDGQSSSVSGVISYTGNRANYSASHNTQFTGLAGTMVENRTSLRMETAIAYAGGKFAVGRPVQGSFAIVSPHDSIKGKSILINPTEDGVMAYSDWMGAVLVPNLSEYSTSRVTYDVDDLPVGYDLGAGAFDFKAPYKSGYALTVGSNYTVTAFGSLVDKKGEPVKLLTGVAWSKKNPSRKVTIFTNSAGRFGAQGLAPGSWTIEMATTPLSRYKLTVPKGTVGLLKVGVLKPVKR